MALLGDERRRHFPPPSEFFTFGFTPKPRRASDLFVVVVLLFFVSFLLSLSVFEIMGQTVTTPLSLTLQHWGDVQRIASNQSVDVRKRRWVTFCSAEWPTFNVGWPQDGTFNLGIISQVKSRVFCPGPHGHPDQVPYIVTWEALSKTPSFTDSSRPPARSFCATSVPICPLPRPYPLYKAQTS